MIRHLITRLSALCLILSSLVIQADSSRSEIRLLVADSASTSGVVDALVEDFEQQYPQYDVEISVMGGIAVLEQSRAGHADIAITHYPTGEKLLIADGFAKDRTYVMYNYFAIFGPADNGLGIYPTQELFDVLKLISDNEVEFMVPSHKSATYKKVTELWQASSILPEWPGYESTGASSARTILQASEFGTFAFTDMSTYKAHLHEIDSNLIPLYRDNELLRNYYSVITLNEDKIRGVNSEGAEKFRNYLLSDEGGQKLVREYGVEQYQHALYVPAAALDVSYAAKQRESQLREKNRTLQMTVTAVTLLLIVLVVASIQYYRFKRLEARKQIDDQRFKLAVEGSHDGIIDWDMVKNTLYLSDRMRSMIKVDAEEEFENFEQGVLSRVRADYREEILHKFDKFRNDADKNERNTFATECPVEVAPGVDVWLNIRCQIMKQDKNRSRRMIGAVTDITKLKQQQLAMEHQALHDSLTDLPNRRLFEDRINQAISMARRHKNTSSVAVMMIDLDNFKIINDTYGHAIGDEVLKQISTSIQAQMREHDTVARLGGDEFGILLTHTDNLRANHVAQKLLLSFKRPITIDGKTLPVSGSIGIAMYPEHGETTESLMKHVDVAMYSAKNTKTGVQIYDTSNDDYSARRLNIEKDLIQAIDNNGLEMHYQPKIDLRRKVVNGAEALLRWEHPEEGFISPTEIIDIAEQSGVIRTLTEWVIETVFRQIATWSTAGLWLPVSINLSVLNLQDRQIATRIKQLLEKYNIEPEQVEFEITESAMIYNPEMALETVAKLSEMGIPLAIDDFGTGFSSLIYLKQLPVHALKIDREFIKNITEDESDQSIVRSTIELGHSFKLNVVAEGVEDIASVNLLSDLGCDMIQGYYVSKPLRVAAFEKFVNESPWAIQTSEERAKRKVVHFHDHNLH